MDKKTRNNIILTADDFGISQEANSSILKLVRLGKIKRVAVIVRGFFTKEEKKELLDSGVKIDVHFNITEDFIYNRKISEGIMKEGLIFIIKFFIGRLNSRKVYESWEEDVRLFVEKFDRLPDGINSHQHVHFFPPFFKIAKKIMDQHQIKFIRFGSKSILGSKNRIKYILNMLRIKNKKIFIESDFTSTKYFVSLDWIKNIEKFIQNIPDGSVEIACHPERKKEFEIIIKYF